MPRGIDTFGIDALKQVNYQNLFHTLAKSQVDKIVLLVDGSAFCVYPSLEKTQHKIYPIDDFEVVDIVLVKKGQKLEISENNIEISSENKTSLIDDILSVVRDKLSLIQPGLTFSNNCKVIIGQQGKLKELTPKADTPEEFAKIFESFFQGKVIEQPQGFEVKERNRAFQIIVPGFLTSIGWDGKQSFVPNNTMMQITILPASPTEKDNADGLSHKIQLQLLGMHGNTISLEGIKYFDWKVTDPRIDKSQLISNVGVDFESEPLSDENDDEEIEEEEIEEIQPINGKKKVATR